MTVEFKFGKKRYRADLSKPIDISVAVSPNGVTAWGLDRVRMRPHTEEGFVGSIAAGASVNFNDLWINPHAHGTHTECLGHIDISAASVLQYPPPAWIHARVVSLKPEAGEQGSVLKAASLAEALGTEPPEAVILRTTPNAEEKTSRKWSGTHPPFLDPAAAAWLREAGVNHLLIDLPSVDPERDGGALAAHKAFWGIPESPRHRATITELVYVPDAAADGEYLLNLQVAPIDNDASPSRPIIFKLIEV